MSLSKCIEEGMYWCSKCQEKIWVTTARKSDTDVPECPFCGNTEHVRSMEGR